MNDLEFKQQVLDPLSPSFCAAKWYNATIWLGSGQTTSCHHPPAHLIDADKVNNNSRLLHNTDQKKADRRDMVLGKRPAGCEYCWKIEDMDTNAVSDRVYKSKIYEIKDINDAYYSANYNQDINLKTLEISFDRTCQFACSYCNPAFSSTWVNDIRRHGPYNGLVSDGRNHFTHTHDNSQLYKFGETNPYVEAFFDWWERDLHKTLQELRITGGEPLMSGYTWKLIEWFKTNQGRSTTRLAINSNLGIDLDKMKEFAVAVATLPKVDLYTSMEATFTQAEYIRDGLDYNQWLNNVLFLLEGKFVSAVHVMCTINALCLDSLVDHLDMMLTLKQRYGRDQLNFTLNILRFPSFQSALVLPDHIRTGYRLQLEAWLYHNRENPCLHEHEVNHVQRLVDYLDVVKTPHSEAFEMPKLLNDFRQFYTQYDQRRGKNFDKCFPKLRKWYNNI